MIEINTYTKRQDQLQAAKAKYQELRWRLNFLETLGGEKDQEPGEEEILKWYTSQEHLGWAD
jgi:hypothetical protein